MPNTRSTLLRPLVSLSALLVVASMVVVPSASAGRPSLPAPQLERAVIALRASDRQAVHALRVLRSAERRMARADRRVERARGVQEAILAQVRLAQPAAVAEIAGALLAATRDRAAAERAHDRLDDVRADAADHLRIARRSRAVVLAGLSLPNRGRALRAEARVRRADAVRRGGTARASILAATFAEVAAGPETADRVPRSSASGIGAVAAAYALTQVGVSYSYAGASPQTGFDCSGLLYWAFARAGLAIPRSSGEIWAAGRRIPRAQAQPGDIVSFGGQGHVGLYLGDGLFVHSTQSGDVVRVHRVADHGAVDGFVRLG